MEEQEKIIAEENHFSLMIHNMKDSEIFYTENRRLLRISFMLFSIMSIAGFIILAVSIFIIFSKNLNLSDSIVPVIGGTIIELISGSFMIMYTSSLKQVNIHYKTIQNDSKLLMAISLANILPDDKKYDTYINIINSQLEILKNQ